MKLSTLLLTSAMLCGCFLFDADADDCGSLTARLDRLESRVTAEIADAEASEVAACRTIAFGDKPCGGPWTYLVYSTETTNETEIQRLVADYNQLDERRNIACELVSDCMMEPMPEAVLEDGRCVADYGGN